MVPQFVIKNQFAGSTAFPTLDNSDLDVLQPLPSDAYLLGPGTPFEGLQYDQVASSAESAWYCAQVLDYVLDGRNALHPEIYRFAFYLFGRVKLVHSAGMKSIKSSSARPDKRPANPDDMVANRHIRVPLQHDPNHPKIVQLHDCEVMMVEMPDDNDAIAQAYVASDADSPGLAILDSGCTRTMHGKQWAEKFEAALASFGLSPKSRVKNQLFAGV